MYNFKLNKYYNTSSFIHNLNPIIKIICILIFTIISLVSDNILFLISLLLFLILNIFLSKVPIKLYINNLKFILPMIIFIFLINLIFTNIYSTIESIIKIILFILYSQILLYTTKPNDITYALEELLSPLKLFKINPNSIALTISLAIRFIPTIFIESDKVIKSQISRGLNFSGNLIEKCDKIISIIFPIFDLSLKRSEDISNVLDIRFYDINSKRTRYKNEDVNKYDVIYLFIHIILLVICFLR